MATATKSTKPSPITTCRKCKSKNLKEVGEPTRRELAGFDPITKTHYQAIEWLHLECLDCGQHRSKQVFIEAKRKTKAAAVGSKSKANPADFGEIDCAKSAPTLRKIDEISNSDEGAIVSIPTATHASEYSRDEPPRNVEQRRQDQRTKRDSRRRRD